MRMKDFWEYVRKAVLWLVILAIVATFADILRFATALAVSPTVGTAIAAQDNPFSQTYPEARERILIIGDSTAVGVGAYIPKETIAGMLATDFPDADIVNKGVSGSRVADVRAQLDAVEGHFDMIVMQAGANDIVFMSNPEDVEKDLADVMDTALARSPHVIVISSIDASVIPLLPKIASLFLAERSAQLLPDIKTVVEEKGGIFVDFYKSDEERAFAEQPEVLFSADGFHPSSDGYRLAYERIRKDLLTRGIVIEEDGRLYIVPEENSGPAEEVPTDSVPPGDDTSAVSPDVSPEE